MKLVKCMHCYQVYDLGKVSVIDRYADCATFRTPCCGKLVDDRTWKSMPDFKAVERPRRGPWTEDDSIYEEYDPD